MGRGQDAGERAQCAAGLKNGGQTEGVEVAKVEDLFEEVPVYVEGNAVTVDYGRIEKKPFIQRQ